MDLEMLSPISEDEAADIYYDDEAMDEGTDGVPTSHLSKPTDQTNVLTQKFSYPTPPCPFSSTPQKRTESSSAKPEPISVAVTETTTLQREFCRANVNHPLLKRAGLRSGIPSGIPGDLCAEIFPESSIRQSLKGLTTAKDAIGSTYSFISKYLYPPGPVLQVLAEQFVSPQASDENSLAVFYLFNELVFKHHWVRDPYTHPATDKSEEPKPDAFDFRALGIERFINAVLPRFSQLSENSRRKMLHCLSIWQKHQLYAPTQCERVRFLINSVSKRDNESSVRKNEVTEVESSDPLLAPETTSLSLENVKSLKSLIGISRKAAQSYQNTLWSESSKEMIEKLQNLCESNQSAAEEEMSVTKLLASLLEPNAMSNLVEKISTTNAVEASSLEKAWARSGRCLAILEQKISLLQEACIGVSTAFEHNSIMMDHLTTLLHQNRHWVYYLKHMKSSSALHEETPASPNS